MSQRGPGLFNRLRKFVDSTITPESQVASRERALRIVKKLSGPRSLPTFRGMADLATCLRRVGRPEEALTIGQDALQSGREQRFKAEVVAVGELQVGLALVALDRWPEAEEHFAQSFDGYERSADAAYAAIALVWLGAAKRHTGELGEATDLLRDALVRMRGVFGEDSRQSVDATEYLAGALQKAGQLQEAEHHARRAVELRIKTVGPDHPDTLEAVEGLCMCMLQQGNFAEAKVLAGGLVRRRKSTFGEDHKKTRIAQRLLEWADREETPPGL